MGPAGSWESGLRDQGSDDFPQCLRVMQGAENQGMEWKLKP